jgi:hypothetical protein
MTRLLVDCAKKLPFGAPYVHAVSGAVQSLHELAVKKVMQSCTLSRQ